MRLDDSIMLKIVSIERNADGDGEEVSTYEPLGKGKCKILPNEAATKKSGEDGKSYSTSYVVFIRGVKGQLPKENDVVHITKKDGSIDKDCTVKGFVTLKTWLKLWVE